MCSHCFKVLLDKIIFKIWEIKHREWFIARRLPHIRVPFKVYIMEESKVLEIVMHLESTPRWSESSVGDRAGAISTCCSHTIITGDNKEKDGA